MTAKGNLKEREFIMKGKITIMMGVFSMMVVLMFGSACQKAAISKPEEDVLRAFDLAIVERTNDFGFNLYKNLALNNENIMISPVSVSLALEMAYNGAAGETREEMAKALNIQGIDGETLNKNNQALLYLLTMADPKLRLDIANSIWLQQGFEFSQVFLNTVTQAYQAEAQTLDFSDPRSVDTINKWVKAKTQDAIEEIVVPPIDSQTIMFLINAVYFKGPWTDPFEKEATSDQPFIRGDQQTVMVPMMFKNASFDYFKNANFEALRLPYGEAERIAMVLFLPDEDSDLNAFQQQLNEKNWSDWMTLFEKKEGAVILPKFKIDYEENLNQALSDLGMGIAFEEGESDFSKMVAEESKDQIKISQVKHKTFIEVDELGTEAAAVTSVEMSLTSMPMNDFELKFDRPFFYAIQDSETGAIIFMGSILDPS